jgi:hypothetical protein
MGCDNVPFCKWFLKFQRTIVHLQEKAAHVDPEDVGTIIPSNTDTHSATLLWEPHICLVYHLWIHFHKYSLCITFVTHRFRERRSPRGHQRLEIIVQTGPCSHVIKTCLSKI